MNALRWILALVLAAFFAFMGVQKFGADNAIFALIAERSGISLFEPFVRMATGAAELLTAVLLLWPKMRATGARLGLLILLGAIGFHLSPWLGLDVPGMGRSLFYMAISAFALAIAVLIAERYATTPPEDPA